MNKQQTKCAEVSAKTWEGFAIAKVWAGSGKTRRLVHQVVLSNRYGLDLVLRRAVAWCEEQGCNWICEQLGEGVVHLD